MKACNISYLFSFLTFNLPMLLLHMGGISEQLFNYFPSVFMANKSVGLIFAFSENQSKISKAELHRLW